MKPEAFKEANTVLLKPPDMSDDECRSLSTHVGDGQIISKWKLTLWERIKILFTGRLWLSVLAKETHPPVALSVDFPFIEQNK